MASLNISDEFTVAECRDKLVLRYEEYWKQSLRPWDKTFNAESYVYPAVRHVLKERGEYTEIELKDSVNDVFGANMAGTLPTRLILQASSGVGKTAAVMKITHDWAYRKLISPLRDLPLLFLIRREKGGREMSLFQAIKSQLLHDVEGLSETSLEAFMKENQGLFHVILDDIIDSPRDIQEGNKCSSNMSEILRKRDLKECRVLVTCHPDNNEKILETLTDIYSYMTLESFSEKQVRAFIDNYFEPESDKSYEIMSHSQLDEFWDRRYKKNRLVSYLWKHRMISEIVSIPLYCGLVCRLWHDNEAILGDLSTQTDLLNFVNIYLWRKAKEGNSHDISSGHLDKVLQNLGKCAHEARRDKRDLELTTNDAREGCELSILIPKGDTKFKFYHDLAEAHLNGMFLSEDDPHLRRLNQTKLDYELIRIRSSVFENAAVIRYIAGSNSDAGLKLMRVIHRNSELDDGDKLRILLDCIAEVPRLDKETSSLIENHVDNTGGVLALRSPTVHTVVALKRLKNIVTNKVRHAWQSPFSITSCTYHR